MISVRNIYKNFGDLKVLKGVSNEIQKGEKDLPAVERVPCFAV